MIKLGLKNKQRNKNNETAQKGMSEASSRLRERGSERSDRKSNRFGGLRIKLNEKNKPKPAATPEINPVMTKPAVNYGNNANNPAAQAFQNNTRLFAEANANNSPSVPFKDSAIEKPSDIPTNPATPPPALNNVGPIQPLKAQLPAYQPDAKQQNINNIAGQLQGADTASTPPEQSAIPKIAADRAAASQGLAASGLPIKGANATPDMMVKGGQPPAPAPAAPAPVTIGPAQQMQAQKDQMFPPAPAAPAAPVPGQSALEKLAADRAAAPQGPAAPVNPLQNPNQPLGTGQLLAPMKPMDNKGISAPGGKPMTPPSPVAPAAPRPMNPPAPAAGGTKSQAQIEAEKKKAQPPKLNLGNRIKSVW